MSHATVRTDQTGRITSWDAGAEKLFGHSAESAIGRPVDLIIPEPLRAAHWAGFHRAMRDPKIKDMAADLPALALDLVEPAGRVVYVGLAGQPSLIDTRTLVLNDVTAIGILSASPGLDDTIAAYATGAVDPRPLVAATVGLDQVSAVLAGERPPDAGPGPKIHVDPRLSSADR